MAEVSFDGWAGTAEFLPVHKALAQVEAKDKALLDGFGITPREMGEVPEGGLFFSFEFTLAGAYLSKDDRAWGSGVTPIRKEWAFRVPMVSETTWKGNIRRAAEYLAEDDANKAQWDGRVTRLFGPGAKEMHDHPEAAREGRVRFFPTYFDVSDEDVFNPHNRQTRLGTFPIPVQRVPKGTKGRFAALYWPFDLAAEPKETRQGEQAMDLRLLAASIAGALVESGFGAKKKLPNNGRVDKTIADLVICTKGAANVGVKSTGIVQLGQHIRAGMPN